MTTFKKLVPVKSEPRDPVPMPPTMSTAMAPVADTASHYQPEQVAHNPMQQQSQANAVALDDSYADESYDYGQYGEYDDGSGMIDPNTGMPMQGAGADGNKDLEDMISKYMTKSDDGLWQCTVCSITSNKKSNMKCHVEAKHLQTQGWQCYICNKHCPSKNAYNVHFHRNHKGQ